MGRPDTTKAGPERGPGLSAVAGRIDQCVVLGQLLADVVHVQRLDLLDQVLQRGLGQGARLGEDDDAVRIAMIVGIERMSNFAPSSCCASVSTLPKTMSGCFSEERS